MLTGFRAFRVGVRDRRGAKTRQPALPSLARSGALVAMDGMAIEKGSVCDWLSQTNLCRQVQTTCLSKQRGKFAAQKQPEQLPV